MKKLCMLLFAAAMLLPACKKQVVQPTPAEALIQRLDSLREKGIMYGHQDDPFYGITWQWEKDRSDTYELTGDYPAVMGFELGGIEKGDAANLDSVPFDWMREEIIKHHERGGIITVSWHPRNPLNGRTAWIESDLKEYAEAIAAGVPADSLVDPRKTVASVLEGGEAHDLFMDWLDRVASFLGSCNDGEGNAIPMIFRPWHENTGSWFWWGEGNCTVEE
ncbi:MAG: beta-mannosidase, partial [Bacteroidales bacterium]|nr:beta-mannosidase [Candidatus Colicola faecequi]